MPDNNVTRDVSNDVTDNATNSVTMRQFELADYEAVHAFWLATEGLGIGPSDTYEEIAKKLQRDPDLFILAEEDGRLVGTVIGGYDGRRGLIYHLAVDSAQRGRGLGRRLMAEVESRLKGKGCYKCYLLVLTENSNARSFYTHLGWEDMTPRDTLMGKVL